jgi:hypothetical protein
MVFVICIVAVATHEFAHLILKWLMTDDEFNVLITNTERKELEGLSKYPTDPNEVPDKDVGKEGFAEALVAIYHADPAEWTEYVRKVYELLVKTLGSDRKLK